MGQIKKTAKGRLDKFYHLAKEQGYRARSAFKLQQLNAKYNFLDSARGLIDLCAAPGGWMQVARKYMPVDGFIVGVDLVPIRPIKGCIGLTEDITTAKCRNALRAEMTQHTKIDCVVHDGAPNVGANWLKDAYTQSELVLKSLELAVEFLETGGTFVTKVFRSQDYNSLMWVFQQLFARVEATKPQASRNVSAEIFVVCQKFKAPAKVDPKFFDPHYVFQSVDDTVKQDIMQRREGKEDRARGGYEDGVTLLFKKASVVDFVHSDEPTQMLTNVNEFEFDEKAKLYTKHPKTTQEIIECFKDIQVLNKKDLRRLLKWRLTMIAFEKQLTKGDKKAKRGSGDDSSDDDSGDSAASSSSSLSEGAKLEKEVAAFEEEKRKKAKRAKRALNRQKAKYRERVAAAMVLPNDIIEAPEDASLFTLNQLSTQKGLDRIAATNKDAYDEVDEGVLDEDEYRKVESESEDLSGSDAEAAYDRAVAEQLDNMYERYAMKKSDRVKKKNLKSRLEREQAQREEDEKDERERVPKPKLSEFDIADLDNEDRHAAPNPLLVKQLGGDRSKADLWFSNPLFANTGVDPSQDDDGDDMAEIAAMAARSREQRGKRARANDTPAMDSDSGGEGSDGGSDDPFTMNERRARGEDVDSKKKKKSKAKRGQQIDAEGELVMGDASSSSAGSDDGDDTFETVPAFDIDSSDDDSEAPNLMEYYDNERDAEALALGRQLLTQAKKREELIDQSYNRYAFNDLDGLPAWFMEDEEKHNVPEVPVTKDEVEAMKARMMELNARPIKKVAEAMARKKMRTMKRMEKVKNKASVILEQSDMSDKAKSAALQKLYKGVESKMKPGSVSVVGRKGQVGSKKKGVKIVDKRQRSDQRGIKRSAERAKKFGRTAHTAGGVGKKRRRLMANQGKSK